MRAERRKTAVLHNQAPGCAPCPLRAPRYSRSLPPVWGVHERVEGCRVPFFHGCTRFIPLPLVGPGCRGGDPAVNTRGNQRPPPLAPDFVAELRAPRATLYTDHGNSNWL